MLTLTATAIISTVFTRAQQTFRDIPYVTHGSPAQKLDLYLPATGTKHPLIIYIHGGAFMFGDKNSPFLPKRLLGKGYAIASLNYRMSGEATFPAAVQDCKSAVRFLRVHASSYKLDPAKFISWGESAGANLAAMLGTTGETKKFDVGENLTASSAVQATIDYYGPTNFLKMDPAALPGSQKHNTADSPESKYLGAQITTIPKVVAESNPITYITKKTPPFFIAHGTNDHTVPFNQSELLVAALKKAGAAVTFHPVSGADHVFQGITPSQSKALNEATDRFLKSITGS